MATKKSLEEVIDEFHEQLNKKLEVDGLPTTEDDINSCINTIDNALGQLENLKEDLEGALDALDVNEDE